MSAMEQSLRRALDAGNPADPEFRETIYAASERALERMLAAKPLDEDAAHEQRIRLAETINRVEADYYAAYGDPEDAAPEPEPEPELLAETPADPAAWDGGGEAGEPDGGTPVFDDPEAPAFLRRTHPVDRFGSNDAPAPTMSVAEEHAEPPRKRPRARTILILLVLLAFAAAVFGIYRIVFPSGTAGAGTVSGGSAAGEGGWIGLFDGRQLASIATPAGGRVEAVTAAGDRPAVRIQSAGEGAEIEVAIGAGAVGELAGKTVRVELTVGSPDGEPREFGVRCLFAGETYCGRQRFTTTQSSESFVLDMAVPAGTREAGSIAFDPGIGGATKALNLFAVRARVGAPA